VAGGRRVHVHGARLLLAPGADRRAPGGAVTVELCGSIEHDPPCTWPHLTLVETDGHELVVTVRFVAGADAADVRARIDRSLRAGGSWTVDRSGPVPPSEEDRRWGLGVEPADPDPEPADPDPAPG
jgi:hypothetical protein